VALLYTSDTVPSIKAFVVEFSYQSKL